MIRRFLFLLILLSIPVHALTPRLTISPFAGVHLATFHITLNSDRYENTMSVLPGAVFGVQLKFKLDDRYTLLTAPAYIRKGSRIRSDWEENTIKSTYRIQYIAIPFRIAYAPFPGLPCLLAGAGINIKLDDMEFHVDEYLVNGIDMRAGLDYYPVVKTVNTDWTLEAGIGMPFSLFHTRCFVEAIYLYGLTDIYDDFNKNEGGFWTRGIMLLAGMNLCL